MSVNVIHNVTFPGIPGIRQREADPGQRAPGQLARHERARHERTLRDWAPHERALRAVRLAAALAGVAAVTAYLVIALSRLSYPFPVEWLESNSLVEVHRILAGQPLYPAPAAGYVPDGYPPLYFAASAAAARVLGVSYLPLRLVSLVSSLACFAVLARLVQRETGSLSGGTAAAGLFAGSYFVTRTWFDAGRVDSLFLALSIGGLYAARRMRGPRGAVAAGVLLAAAALTKQTGFAEAVAVPAVLFLGPRRRLALVAALTEAAILGATTLGLGLASGGWYVYYVFELMSQHSLALGSLGGSWLAALGLAALAAVIGARRMPPESLAGCAALVLEGCAALVHSGGGVNDVLPAYLAVALLAGLALGTSAPAVPAPAVPAPRWRRILDWRAPAAGVLVLVQSVFLISSAHPARAIPTSADRAAGERLVTGMRAIGGTISDPADPGLSLQAGMPPAAQEDAAGDVLRARDQAAITGFRDSVAGAITRRRFSAIISESPGPPPAYPPALLDRYYRRCPQTLLAGVPAGVFRPVDGVRYRPVSVWLPRGRGSCAAAVSALDGTA